MRVSNIVSLWVRKISAYTNLWKAFLRTKAFVILIGFIKSAFYLQEQILSDLCNEIIELFGKLYFLTHIKLICRQYSVRLNCDDT